MSWLHRRKSISCDSIRIVINGVPISRDEEITLNFHPPVIGWSEETKLSRTFLPVPDPVRHRHSSTSSKGSGYRSKLKCSSTTNLNRSRSTGADLVDMVDRTFIGKGVIQNGPFGRRKIIYLDYTASGKSLKCIEDFIQQNVLPYYANTHTASSFTSIQTTKYREEARDYVRTATAAGDDDAVIFHGSGTTSCVHKLVHHVLCTAHEHKVAKATVCIGPFEHHSNILPWREAGAEIVNIPVDKYGGLDRKFLKRELKRLRSQSGSRILIGCFSAASNVTGIVSDDVALTVLMHKYNGLAFFDYAAAAPHVKVVMNPISDDPNLSRMGQKDAIYFSGHKFMGGPQTTGVLIVKKHLLKNPIPHTQGGGTVDLVTPGRHVYVQDIVEREEGGTPSIVENIRLGLVMKLKMSIGEENIVAREANFVKRAFNVWSEIPNLIILGDTNNPRIPIVSFMVEHFESGYYLHHNFVATLLNDLFGIQCRGGCMCAGPYAQILLEVDEQLALEYEKIFAGESDDLGKPGGDDFVFKPGFTRISFPYHASFPEVDYTIEAVAFVAAYGWKLLPDYNCNLKTGNFTFSNPTNISRPKSLSIGDFDADGLTMPGSGSNNNRHIDPPTFEEALEFAGTLVHKKVKHRMNSSRIPTISLEAEKLRWFLLPSEAFALLENPSIKIRAPRSFVAHKIQFKIKGMRKIVAETLSGSILDQVLHSVWTNSRDPLTKKIVAEDLRVRENRNETSSKSPSGSISASSGYIDSDESDDL